MFDPAGAAIRVTLPELPQTYAGSRIAVLEGQSATLRFDRTDTTREATFVFRPPTEQDGIATQFFGYDPARPPVIHFAAGEVGPKYLTIGAVENTTSDGLPETLWGFEAISGISRFEGLEEPPGNSEMLPVIFLNNDVSAERDIVTGGPSDDVFAPGGAGDDSFNGSYGIDTVTLLGLRAQYTVQTQPLRFGPRVFDQVEGRDSTDSVLNVERLRFADGILAIDAEGNAGQAYRLYQAAFARDPDISGLVHQIGALDAGLGLNTLAANFIASAEFVARYGTAPSDAELVTLLYRNGLGREPDAAGFQAHTEGLASGITRDQLLINFSESLENRIQTWAETADGIWLG